MKSIVEIAIELRKTAYALEESQGGYDLEKLRQCQESLGECNTDLRMHIRYLEGWDGERSVKNCAGCGWSIIGDVHYSSNKGYLGECCVIPTGGGTFLWREP